MLHEYALNTRIVIFIHNQENRKIFERQNDRKYLERFG